MSHDQPPRQPLAPPFSRPTHPGPLPAVSPDSEAGRPLRPTPYASAVIPGGWPLADPTAGSAHVAGNQALPPEATGEGSPSGRTDADTVPAAAGGTMPTGPVAADLDESGQGVLSGDAAAEPWEDTAVLPAASPRHSLRDLPGDHDHATGVPANPEVAVEAVDTIADYPVEASWWSETVFGWGTSEADWDAGQAEPSGSGPTLPTAEAAAASTAAGRIAATAAAVLESLAGAIRRGELGLAPSPEPRTPPAILAAVLAALLARPADDQWEPRDAREARGANDASTAEQVR